MTVSNQIVVYNDYVLDINYNKKMFKFINLCSVATVIATGTNITVQPLTNLADGDTPKPVPAPTPPKCGDYQVLNNAKTKCVQKTCGKNEIV